MPATVSIRTRDGATFAVTLGDGPSGLKDGSEVTDAIAQLASRVTRHEQNPGLQTDNGAWVRLEHVVSIEPVLDAPAA